MAIAVERAPREGTGSPFLQVAQLSKTFTHGGKRRRQHNLAVKDFNLEARRGECITIIGPSGCGKSTVLNCVAGLVAFDSGTVSVAGKAVDGPVRNVPWCSSMPRFCLGGRSRGTWPMARSCAASCPSRRSPSASRAP